MENYDKSQTGQEVEQGLKKAPNSAKKAYKNAKKLYKNKDKIKKGASAIIKIIKEILIHLVHFLIAMTQFIISLVGVPVLIAVVVIFMATFALFSWNLDSFDSFDEFEDSLGETCKVTYTDTYEIINKNFIKKQEELIDKVKDILVEKYGNISNHNFSFDDLSYEYDGDGTCTIIGDLTVEADEDNDGYTDHIYVTKINFPININDGSGGSLVDSIVGYIEANYTVIKTYNENFEGLEEAAKGTTTIFVEFDKETKDGKMMTSDLCKELKGELYPKGCKYSYTPSVKTQTKTGTCKFNGETWNNDGDQDHECTTDEWKAKNKTTASYETISCKLTGSGASRKYVSEDGEHDTECGKLYVPTASGGSVPLTQKIQVKAQEESEPIEDSSYTYQYQVEVDLTQDALEDFDLNDYKSELQDYINEDKLFFYPSDETINEEITTNNAKINTSSSSENVEVGENSYTCEFSDGTNIRYESQSEIEYGQTNCDAIGGVFTEHQKSNIQVTTETLEVSSSKDTTLTIYTKIDVDDASNFLYEEKQVALENIEKLNKLNDVAESAEYTYNTTLNQVVETINFACPDNQISLNLITGASYSGFGAITGAVDAPEVFGNSAYWYDSSGDKGVWDYTQIARKDVYDAIWSYAATGAGTVSGWWNGYKKVGTPQCTDFVNARFYAQYGFHCDGHNGQDEARNTVALYPDKFTDGIDANGKLNLKAGSIISQPGTSKNPCGHVGFIEAVEADSSGNITSITISDANFFAVPGGIRLHCVYTWEQFVSAWGQNCTFAVPIN